MRALWGSGREAHERTPWGSGHEAPEGPWGIGREAHEEVPSPFPILQEALIDSPAALNGVFAVLWRRRGPGVP